MLRFSRRTWAVVGALFIALAISVACGETLPETPPAEVLPQKEAGSDAPATDRTGDTGTGTDSGAEEGGEGDGGCTAESPYGDASALDRFEELNAGVTSVRLNRDGGQVAYLSWDQGGGYHVGQLPYPLEPSPLPQNILSAPIDEENAAPLADERMVFWDQPIDGGARRIHSSKRSSTDQKLENAVIENIPLGTKTQTLMPWLIAGTETLYFVMRGATTNTADIYRGVRDASTWTITTEIDHAADDLHPVVTDDELTMYFARSLAGGKKRVYVTTRTAAGASWGPAIEMQGDVNTTDHDSWPTWVSPDRCTLLFISTRFASQPRPYKIVRVAQ